MPATVTHAYFSNDVYDILPNQIKERISLSRIKMFGQGTDPFMFYHLFSVKPGKKIRLMQRVCHRQHTRDFFCQFIEDIKKNHLEEDSDVCSFLCGFICHYVLDSTVHPFVIYKTGNFDKHNKATYKYNNLHLFMETYLDNHLIRKREHQNPYSFSIVKYSFDLAPFSSGLNQVIHSSFDKVYHVSNMDSIYYQALKDMKFSLRVFRQDRFGIKKFFYKLADTFTPRRCFRFEAISYHYTMHPSYDFLNFRRRLWRNPTTYSITSHDSFYDLYIKSLKLAKKIIEDTFGYLSGQDIDLNSVFKNLSYTTGLDCDEHKELKYFEF